MRNMLTIITLNPNGPLSAICISLTKKALRETKVALISMRLQRKTGLRAYRWRGSRARLPEGAWTSETRRQKMEAVGAVFPGSCRMIARLYIYVNILLSGTSFEWAEAVRSNGYGLRLPGRAVMRGWADGSQPGLLRTPVTWHRRRASLLVSVIQGGS